MLRHIVGRPVDPHPDDRNSPDDCNSPPGKANLAREIMVAPYKLASSASMLHALRIARVVLAIPAPFYLVLSIYWVSSPVALAHLSSLEPMTAMTSPGAFFWGTTLIHTISMSVSMLLQSCAKRAEDRMFSWDSIPEISIWCVSSIATQLIILHSDRSRDQPAKVYNSLWAVAIFVFFGVCFYITTGAILNGARQRLTRRKFELFVVSQVRVAFCLALCMAGVEIICNMGMRQYDMPSAYTDWAQDFFPVDAVSELRCVNETLLTDWIEQHTDCDDLICGFANWRIACRTIQLSPALTALSIFSCIFPAQLFGFWYVYMLYYGTNNTTEAVDYSLFFKPHMMLGILFLILNIVSLLYQGFRFLFLLMFLAQQPVITPETPGLELPGACYGACGRIIFMWGTLGNWVLLCLFLNGDRLYELFVSRRREREQQDQLQKELKEMQATLMQEKQGGYCAFFFVDAEFIRFSEKYILPPFNELQEGGHLLQLNIGFEAALQGRFDNDEFCVVSHRWFNPDSPDDGVQLLAIKMHLQQRPSIKYVWYDFWCMPQGKRTPAESAHFNWMLQNVNLLYAGMKVLILIDLSYLSRFWTQYEAWLSCQVATPDGLRAASEQERRCTIVPVLNANSSIKEALLAMWQSKTPQEAHGILKSPDVTVTNLSDKEHQLEKILSFDRLVISAFKNLQ